jgi:UDP-glucose 4-epimerase
MNDIQNKKILITGASGFIGSFLVEEALQRGYTVYAGVRKSSSRQYLQHKDLRFIELDLGSTASMTKEFQQATEAENGAFDYIIHNAGITEAKNKKEFHEVNFEYSRNLAEAIQQSSLPLKKFMLISSLASFGPGNGETMEPISISDLPNPISEYARSKLNAAQYISLHSKLPHIIIYPTGVYGPRDRGFFQFFKLINGGFEPYVGSNKQKLSFIYVKDLAKAVIALLPTGQVNKSYLLSDGRCYDKDELGTEAKQALNKKTFKLNLPLAPVRMAISGVDLVQQTFFNRLPFINREKLKEICSANWVCDSHEIWDHINDQPSFNLKEGVKETLDWYRENEWIK